MMSSKFVSTGSLAALIAAMSFGFAQAEPMFAFYAPPSQQQMAPQYPQYPVEAVEPEQDAQIDPRFQRQIVSYQTREAPGTIIVDTPNTFLYYVLGDGQAIRYGIGVGREGFTWSGVKHVARKAEWPDWRPPQEMIARQPYLPRFTAGGPGNPLGARAMYLGGTVYRIHGTNDPTTIGKDVSSGCIRLTNEDVKDLYARVQVGAKVVVLPQATSATVAQAQTPADAQPQRQFSQRMPVSSSYAAPNRAQRTWASIRQTGLY
ncbi:MAG: L,D-transpeptidase [Pseudolabrys sp.]|nr:L,D-transpeptidase [Pseudolabrys sp.]